MTTAAKILVVDDEESILWVFKKALEKRNLTVHTAPNADEALRKIGQNHYLMVFTDIFMEGKSGLELLAEVKQRDVSPHVVVMTAQDTMNNTIEAMRQGAFDYVSKPFDFDEVYALIDRALASREVAEPPEEVSQEAEEFSVESIIGKSKQMQTVFKTIGKASNTDLSVLITGESGTGKEMVARALHFYSQRVNTPFIAINCAAISRELLESELFGHEKGAFTGAVERKIGKFELANRGTLFLDEIGDMEMPLQAKILRVLQDSEFYRVGGREPVRVNVKVIAATNQDLTDLMERNLFREDLFHRLNVIHMLLPPLRERLEDVPLLASHFLSKFSGTLTPGRVYLSPTVEKMFQNYDWPGNIRELENVLKRGVVLASEGPILPEHLPETLRQNSGNPDTFMDPWERRLEPLVKEFLLQNQESQDGNLHGRLTESMEKELFEQLLRRFHGNQVATAKALGINRNTLKRKIDSLKIEPKNNAPARTGTVIEPVPSMKTETVVSINSPFGTPLKIIRQTFTAHSQPAQKRMAVLTGLHGDEWEGLYICHQLLAYLTGLQRTRPEAFTGDVHIYPAANPQALNHLTRQWPFSGVDMNRTMGNSGSRSLPEEVARQLLDNIKSSADMAVDIHASNLHLKELPQVRVLEEFTKKLLPLARQSNTDLVWVHPMAGLFESTLGYNLNANKVPTLVIETGICLRIHPQWGNQVVTGLVHLMKQNGVLVPDVSLPGHLRTPWVIGPNQVVLATASHSGLFVGNAELGSHVKKGDTIGTVLDPLRGELLQEVTAPESGLLFTLREVPAVYKGALLARVALEEEPEP